MFIAQLCETYLTLVLVNNQKHSETTFATDKLGQHDPVSHQAIDWVLKGRRLIVFKTKVTNPGKAITHHRQSQEPYKLSTKQAE